MNDATKVTHREPLTGDKLKLARMSDDVTQAQFATRKARLIIEELLGEYGMEEPALHTEAYTKYVKIFGEDKGTPTDETMSHWNWAVDCDIIQTKLQMLSDYIMESDNVLMNMVRASA